jgi:Ca2+/H+ antiporter
VVNKEAEKEFIYAIVSLFLSLSICGPLASIVGIMAAKRARDLGHPYGHLLYVVHWVLMSLFIAGVVSFVLFSALFIGAANTGAQPRMY